ncbi:MAG TPA: histidine phosphatase family protein [Tepidiformaceae bacterium]|nr:histidine phosphatase family protein [Tepidiformaceae bacterium]
MKVTRIYLTRHGQTVTNKEGRFCGHAETRLTPLGEEQARALGRRLAAEKFDACYTSGLGRAVETAALIAGERRLRTFADPDLRELHYGDWELEKESVIRRRSPEQFALMRAEDPAWRPPGGETVGEVRARTAAAFERIVAGEPGHRVLVVSHGTAINCLLSALLEMPESHVFRIDVANCGLTEIEVRSGRVSFVRINETAHLAALR